MHETLKRYFDAIRDGDGEAWVSCYAPAFEASDPVGSPARTRHDELRAFYAQIRGLFETIEFTPEKVYPGGSEIALTWNARGVGKNGRSVTFEGIDVFTLDTQGLITGLKAYWDMAPTLAALTS